MPSNFYRKRATKRYPARFLGRKSIADDARRDQDGRQKCHREQLDDAKTIGQEGGWRGWSESEEHHLAERNGKTQWRGIVGIVGFWSVGMRRGNDQKK